MDVLVADEVWIATALLHRRYPEREDFAVSEIIRQAEAESVTGRHSLCPSFQDYAYFHCVANKEPGAVRHRMLLETAKGRRRLFKPGDPCDRRRLFGQGRSVRRRRPGSLSEVHRVVPQRIRWRERRDGSNPVPARARQENLDG